MLPPNVLKYSIPLSNASTIARVVTTAAMEGVALEWIHDLQNQLAAVGVGDQEVLVARSLGSGETAGVRKP